MAKEFDERLYDRRVLDRNLKNGLVERKDYERYIKSLEDQDENAMRVRTELSSSGHTPKSVEDEEEG